MDLYYKKTRRPTGLAIKRPPQAITPPKPAKIPNTPTTPTDARLTRPLVPPPIKRKEAPPVERRRPVSVKQLFSRVHPQHKDGDTTESASTTTTTTIATPLAQPLFIPNSPNKITSGPLKGVSTSLLDTIRAKEAAARSRDPEREHQLRLLGIAPEVVRIVPTVFTASKRETLPFDRVVEKCFKGLNSNYTSETIIDCLQLMDKIAPDWISTVVISKGKFMRINKDKYTIPILLNAIKSFKAKHHKHQ